jgi:hypothetical protein
MRLVDDCPIQNGDIVLTTEEAKRYDMQVLRNLASQSNSDAISGRSTKLELQSYFSRQTTINDYHE